MTKRKYTTFLLLCIFALTTFLTQAQDSTKKEDKIPGATVQGRLVYDDTSRPIRFVKVGLIEADDPNSYYTEIHTATNHKGEFELKDVKAGDYYLYVKSPGILNTENYYDSDNEKESKALIERTFQKVSVSGRALFRYDFRVKRGGSISGIVRYADGAEAVNVEVEVLKELGDKFYAIPVSQTNTDDRGFYRLAGLLEGNYIVRAVEPLIHKPEQERLSYFSGNSSLLFEGKDYLKTYFPSSNSTKDASKIEVFYGQEQTSTDITIQKRELFDVSGKVILKNTGEELKNFEISFYKLDGGDAGLTYGKGLFGDAIGTSGYSSEELPSEWILRRLPKGKYRISARQVTPYSLRNKDLPKYADVDKEIEITDGDLENVLLEVLTSGTIKGIIYDKDGRNLSENMSIYGYNLTAKNSERADIDSSKYKDDNPASQKQMPFEINKLTAGKIRFSTFSDDFYISRVIVRNQTLNAGEAFDFQEGETLQGVQIVVGSDMGTVKGKVAGAEEIRSVGIYLLGKEDVAKGVYRNSHGTAANVDGTYEFKAAPGDYFIIVLNQSVRDRNEDYEELLKAALLNAPSISVKAYQTNTLNLSMPE